MVFSPLVLNPKHTAALRFGWELSVQMISFSFKNFQRPGLCAVTFSLPPPHCSSKESLTLRTRKGWFSDINRSQGGSFQKSLSIVLGIYRDKCKDTPSDKIPKTLDYCTVPLIWNNEQSGACLQATGNANHCQVGLVDECSKAEFHFVIIESEEVTREFSDITVFQLKAGPLITKVLALFASF